MTGPRPTPAWPVLDARRRAMLEAMGIVPWWPAEPTAEAPPATLVPPLARPPAAAVEPVPLPRSGASAPRQPVPAPAPGGAQAD
jgi:hypothetical protein